MIQDVCYIEDQTNVGLASGWMKAQSKPILLMVNTLKSVDQIKALQYLKQCGALPLKTGRGITSESIILWHPNSVTFRIMDECMIKLHVLVVGVSSNQPEATWTFLEHHTATNLVNGTSLAPVIDLPLAVQNFLKSLKGIVGFGDLERTDDRDYAVHGLQMLHKAGYNDFNIESMCKQALTLGFPYQASTNLKEYADKLRAGKTIRLSNPGWQWGSDKMTDWEAP